MVGLLPLIQVEIIGLTIHSAIPAFKGFECNVENLCGTIVKYCFPLCISSHYQVIR